MITRLPMPKRFSKRPLFSLATLLLPLALLTTTPSHSNADQPLQISALHPLMADLAHQVGGDRVNVFDLIGEGGDPHFFQPRPSDMRTMQASHLILASGKNMEPYLDALKDTLGAEKIVDVGRTIPSLRVGEDQLYTCCPAHSVGMIDPHWWHGIGNMKRAARVVANAFSNVDPNGKAIYEANARAYSQRLDQLEAWAKREIAKIPRRDRKLVTVHTAFAYFAQEFGFQIVSLQGLTREQEPTPQHLADSIAVIKRENIRAIVPEKSAASKSLDTIVRATGVPLGDKLVADGNGKGNTATFEGMIQHNVTAIVAALGRE
jgi:zinc/manganese transport system substrate-binding protein